MIKQESYIEQMIVSLRTRLLVMGASVEIAVDNMKKAVADLNVGTAQAVIENDDDIDAMENEIDASSLALLARTQPVAKDLRFVVSALRMVVDMERIGDECTSICSQVVLMKDADKKQIMDYVGEHLQSATDAFRSALKLMRNNNAEEALTMQHTDDEALQSEVAIIERMMRELECNDHTVAHPDPVLIMHLILLVHSLTRIWRRSANIAGHIYFASLGDSLKHAPEKMKAERLHF
ncbi:MAG TPA: PhoU family transcriptional regulator [Candidatus Desulfovibrio intestinipullorum]|uniref:PhoU family transcriptional regulator n=1 Tax=Candidatus Desulfovibrio intestinipullorum TaxID=2838536 RepID=A0A9D1PWP3_9BACT|nr:PhoU family transcriptional regulator [Candidatus Desulfovibrio intestinipullorum]